tara:strand:+ start:1341 stop:1766 length:426 start_codon:yes stop_codon:yes gene_type:complete
MAYWKNRDTKKREEQPASASASRRPIRAATEVPAFSTLAMAGGTQSDTLIAEPKVKVKRPSFYRVVLLNDDYTPMDFVVTILETIFRKTHEEAVQVMLEIHQKGAAVCGVFTRDIAETKADQVVEVARVNDYPLQCVIEPE